MIRRLWYHGFWNFYDYLGAYLVMGLATGLIPLFLVTNGIYAIALGTSPLIRTVAAVLLLLVFYGVITVSFAALFPFASKVSRGEPARLSELWSMLKLAWPRYMKLVALITIFLLVLIANVIFYFRIAGTTQSRATGMATTVAGTAFAWIGVAFLPYILSVLSECGSTAESSIKVILRRSFILLAIAPGTWAATAILLLLLSVLAVLSRAGIIFLFPVIASMACTAHFLVTQYTVLLSQVKDEIGEGKPLRAYKIRATELAWEWECRQPRRTFRELIKPWEY